MTCGIYKITNKLNGKSYIGASNNIEKRWNHHRSKSQNKRMSKLISKIGRDNFTFTILEECSEDELMDKERYYIKKHNTKIPNGYNKSKGGDGENITGYYYVHKCKENLLLGYTFKYTHYYGNGAKKVLSSYNLHELEKKSSGA